MNNKSVDKVVFPNRGNLWTAYVLFGGFTLVTIILGLYKGVLISSGVWVLSLFPLIPLLCIYAFIKAQTVILSEQFITHTKLGFFRIQRKTFSWDEIDHWRQVHLTLIVVKKGAKVPDLPVGFFEDVSQVLLIPASLFMPNTKQITDYLTEKGIREKRGK